MFKKQKHGVSTEALNHAYQLTHTFYSYLESINIRTPTLTGGAIIKYETKSQKVSPQLSKRT